MKRETITVSLLAAFWLAALIVTFETKARAGYLGIPFVTVALVGYLIWLSSKMRPTNETKKTETKNGNE